MKTIVRKLTNTNIKDWTLSDCVLIADYFKIEIYLNEWFSQRETTNLLQIREQTTKLIAQTICVYMARRLEPSHTGMEMMKLTSWFPNKFEIKNNWTLSHIVDRAIYEYFGEQAVQTNIRNRVKTISRTERVLKILQRRYGSKSYLNVRDEIKIDCN